VAEFMTVFVANKVGPDVLTDCMRTWRRALPFIDTPSCQTGYYHSMTPFGLRTTNVRCQTAYPEKCTLERSLSRQYSRKIIIMLILRLQ